uniref:uroporphyrinogen-III synthase n=1 Tax=Flavobacterium sp. TaxID=239 RepID=UPI00404A2F7C
MQRILSTKILAPHQKKWLLHAGLSVVEFDFIKIKSLDFEIKSVHEFLIFTSQNAVNQIIKHPDFHDLQSRKCFCVGEKTAQLLQSNQFSILEKTNDAKTLADLIVEKYQSNSFTFFSGESRLDTLPEMLHQNSVVWNEISVYETVLNSERLNISADGILFFSPSGVESFLQKNNLNDAECFCIGQTTAKKLADFTQKITIANQPTIENVIIQAINYFKNDKPITQT